MRHEGVDDMDYVEELGLDPALAYTPEINEAIIKNIRANNYADYIGQGVEPSKAEAMADELANRARQNVKTGNSSLKKLDL